MALVKGPFELTWGANTLTDIEEIEVSYEPASEDYTTVQHSTYEVDGPVKAGVTLTLLGTDIASLAAVLPQHFVAQGGTMSTGETVDSSVGAIDVVPTCDDTVNNDLEILSCGVDGQVLRLVNARTRIESIENDATLRKVMVKFIGESAGGVAPVQFFVTGGIS
jgi:hypothetical protein